MRMHAGICVCVYERMHVHTHVRICAHTCGYVSVHVYICAHMCIQVDTDADVHVCMDMYFTVLQNVAT